MPDLKEHMIEDIRETFYEIKRRYIDIRSKTHVDMGSLPILAEPIANLFVYYALEGRECIPILKQVLYDCKNQEFCLHMFDEIEDIALSSSEHNKETTIIAIISFCFRFYFEQNTYPIKYSSVFSKIILNYTTHAQVLHYCEEFLLPYISDVILEVPESEEAARAYMAIDVLIPSGSLKAYSVVRSILVKEEVEYTKWEYWEIRLRGMYEELYSSKYIRNQAFTIGLLWEQLCQDICKECYQDVLTNHDGVRFENNLIPDIVVGEIKTNGVGAITYAEMVIECKKSTYFLTSDSLRDQTDTKYLEYCDSLEYWILEKPDFYVTPQNRKIKYRFAEDMSKLAWLDHRQIKKIKTLIDDSKQGEKYSPETISQEKNIYTILIAIDKLLESIKSSTSEQMTKTAYKSNFVIRQYDRNGLFIREYTSVIAAARTVGLTRDAITNVTSGRRNSAGGYLWKKCVIGTPIENIKPPNTALDLMGKTIFQVDQYGEVVAIYNTIGQAEKATGVSRRSISDALKGIQKTAGGFRWILGSGTVGQ